MAETEAKNTAAEVARTPFGILKATVAEWQKDRASRLSAALAYHTIFALAPLLVIAVSVAGAVFGPRSVRSQLVRQVLEYTGSPQIAEFVDTLIGGAAQKNASTLATIAGVFFLFVGASNLFNELKAALNTIWDAPTINARGILGVLISRALSIGMVALTGVVLIGTLALTTVLTRATGWLGIERGGSSFLGQAIGFVFAYGLTLLVFAMIYRFIPDIRIAWRDVWSGAAVTALLFSVGRLLLSLYLGFSSVGSTYGAAGSLLVVLLWIYYSAQIFFFGAEFTQVFARTRGSRWREAKKLDAPSKTAT